VEKIICDTDVMIDFFDSTKPRHQQTAQVINTHIGIDNIVLSAITKMELIAGAENKTELRLLNKNISRFDVLLINAEITSIALNLIENYRLSHNLYIPDAIIAATASYSNLKLFTYNIKDYKFIQQVILYDSSLV
jgi:predicted nucleic acid-binding protein